MAESTQREGEIMGDVADYTFEAGLQSHLAHVNGECGQYGPCQECDEESTAKRRARKLSPAQERVMKWLLGGWEATQLNGSAIEINGKRVCNADTMTALERKGLVERHNTIGGLVVDVWFWRATEKAKQEAGK